MHAACEDDWTALGARHTGGQHAEATATIIRPVGAHSLGEGFIPAPVDEHNSAAAEGSRCPTSPVGLGSGPDREDAEIEWSTEATSSPLASSMSSDAGYSGSEAGGAADSRVLGPVSLASWNTQGLLSGYFLEGPSLLLFRRRLRRIQRLLDDHMVVFLQETRATQAEVEILKAYFPGTTLYDTCGVGAAAGGLITMVSRHFALDYPRQEFLTIIPGRASVLRCAGTAGAHLDLLNLHLTPHAQAGDPVRQLRRIRRWVRPRAHAATVIAGDVNFVDAAEGRLNVDIGRAEFADEVAASAFGHLFSEFAEVAPHGYTRAQHRVEEGVRRVALLARIDRCWASLPTTFLCSRSARAAVLDPVADGTGLSDHAPVGLRWEAEPREKLARIPDWIARHL